MAGEGIDRELELLVTGTGSFVSSVRVGMAGTSPAMTGLGAADGYVLM